MLAQDFGHPRYFLATAAAVDDEMRDRIKKHREERGNAFVTIEEQTEIAGKLRENMILDCVPMWLNNLFYYGKEAAWETYLENLLSALPSNIVIVTNEIGWGLIPDNPLARKYEDTLGKINTKIAACSDRVELMVAGIPLVVK